MTAAPDPRLMVALAGMAEALAAQKMRRSTKSLLSSWGAPTFEATDIRYRTGMKYRADALQLSQAARDLRRKANV